MKSLIELSVKQKESQLAINPHANLHSFYLEDDEKFHKVSLEIHNKTTYELITEAIDKLNENSNLNLIRDPKAYELYGAKKNGKKKGDLPSIEHQQILCQTNLKRFYLQPLYPLSNPRTLKNSPSSLQSEIW